MKNTIWIALAIFGLISCAEKPKVETEVSTPVTLEPAVNVADIVVPAQPNIVTPEFWGEFKTDIKAIFFFSKVDSLETHFLAEKKMVKDFATKHNIDYHEYYTNEDLGMVQLNDTLFFDLSDYLMSSGEGFVFLKPGASVNVNANDVPVILKSSIEGFFK